MQKPVSDLGDRLQALQTLGLLDTPPEERFDRITSLASRLLGTPVSLIGLVDAKRQWNKSRLGMDDVQWPLEASICRHVVEQDAPLEVPDLVEDERFKDNRFVLNGARFYAGWPLRNGNGVALGALCVLDDVPRVLTPEQRDVMSSLAAWAQAELNAAALGSALEQLRASERDLLRLLDEAPAAVLLTSSSGTVEFANTPARRLLGEGPGSSLVGSPMSALLPTVDLEELQGQGRRTSDVDSPAGRRFVQPGRRGDGTAFPAELTVSVTGGERRRYIVFVRDLSGEATSESKLAELRQRTELVFDALSEGVLVVEPDGRLSFGNLASAQMVQRRRTDLPGAALHDLLHHAHAEVDACELKDPVALAGRTISPVDVKRGDGSVLPVEMTVRLVRGTSPGVVVTLHDLTDRLRNERLKTELVSAVSHELRTPLTSIRGSLSLLRAKVIDPSSEQGARMIEVATESTERLSRLVNDILDLERLQAGKVELVMARQRAAALMLSAAQAVSGAAAAASVRVAVMDSDEHVIADNDRAVQILVNLLGNAVKFSPEGSAVTLSARREGSRVLLSVADQGRGIPPEELSRIFDRFAQIDGSDSREHDGTGLGLAIAKGLAEQHGGAVSATSTVGEGSTFVLDLPAATARKRRLAYGPATSVPDELAQLLADRGWEVRPVQPGGLVAAGAGAVMLTAAGPGAVVALQQEAADLRLPLLALTTSGAGGPELTAAVAAAVLPEHTEGRVLVVEDDDDVAEVLCTALSARGLDVERAATQQAAVKAAGRLRPDLLVLDVRLAGGDGFGVVDDLRGQGLGDAAPIVVYSVLELDAVERERLQTGGTEFLTKGRDRIDDVVRDVMRLLGSRRVPVAPMEDM